MTDTFGFEKPEDWSEHDVEQYATLQSEQDEDYDQVASIDVAAMTDTTEGLA